MRFSVTYIAMKLRELLRSKIYMGFGVFMLLLALGMSLLMPRVDQNSPYTIVVLNEHKTQLGEAVIAALERDGGYRLRSCADSRELKALVLSGEVLCGYAFDERADEQLEDGRYTELADSFYREKSPAAALCDEAVCGAIFAYASPVVAVRYLERSGLGATVDLQTLTEDFAATASGEGMMKVTLLEEHGAPMEVANGGGVTNFLYSIFCSLTAIFAITTAFYTQSIDKLLVFAGQKPAQVGLCSLLSYSASYLVILAVAHLAVSCFMPELLTNGRIAGQLLLTAVAGGGLQSVSRRFLSPAVLPLLPFVAVLLVAATSL